MTKPKIANGNSINPLSRLEKRLEECKNHHNESIANCNKIQESHNKINLELKLSLERKSKISDSKVKKKRSTNGTTVNRKKSKIVPDKVQSKQFYENCLESTPHAPLNVHSSEFPDIDLDSFDILKDSNFPMSINEQELDIVLNNCCPQQSIVNDLFPTQMPSDQIYSYKSSTQTKVEPITPIMTTNKFKIEESVNTPLFPPPEVPANSRLSSNANVDYTSPSYIPPNNYNNNNTNANNYANNIVATPSITVKSENMKYSSNMYSLNPMNNPLSNPNPATSYNYQYSNPLNPMGSDMPPNNSQQYFYQYVNFPTATNYSDLPSNSSNNFQLPTMSSGWYNNPPTQPVKQTNCKPQLPPPPPPQQQFVNIPTTTSNYLNNFSHYQMDSHSTNHALQCQQVFNNHYDTSFPNNQSYNIMTQPNLTSYNMIPPDQNSYYYVDYSNVTTNRNNGNNTSNLSMIGQNDSQFITNHSNTNICRNVYPSHCI